MEHDDTHGRLRWTALAALVAGCFWLWLEYRWRGGYAQIVWWPEVIRALLWMAAAVGLALRPRMSIAGEWQVVQEMAAMALVAVFLVPAAMLGLYGLSFGLSVVIRIGAELVWLLGVLFAILVQLFIWGASLAGWLALLVAIGNEKDRPAALFLWVMGAGSGALAAAAVRGQTGSNPWDGSVVPFAFKHRDWLPDWNMVTRRLHDSLHGLDDGAAISLAASMAAGLTVGLAAAVAVRLLRQWLMTFGSLRPYLPGAAAPLPDRAPWLETRLVVPAAAWLSIGFMLFAAWQLGGRAV